MDEQIDRNTVQLRTPQHHESNRREKGDGKHALWISVCRLEKRRYVNRPCV